MTRPRPSDAGTRRAALVWLATSALAASVLALPASAQMFDHPSLEAKLAWGPATGATVRGYGVWVAWDGEGFPEPLGAPQLVTSKPEATIPGFYGTSFRVRVAATDGVDFGPVSAPSHAIRLVPPNVVGMDLDGNHVPDVVFRPDGGNRSSVIWLMTENGPWLQDRMPAHSGSQSSTWKLVGSSDLNDDGKADLLWFDPETGATQLWTMAGTKVDQVFDVATRGPGWLPYLVSRRAVTGSGRVVWVHQPTGLSELWEIALDGDEVVIDAEAELPQMTGSQAWEIAGSCDLDGDRVDDLVWRDTTSDAGRIWLMDELAVRDELVDDGTLAYVECADFDGDGTESLVLADEARDSYQLWTFTDGDGNGNALGDVEQLSRGASGWALIDAADVNADGALDMIEFSADARIVRIRTVDPAVAFDNLATARAPGGRVPLTVW